jgi:hypothetical protein
MRENFVRSKFYGASWRKAAVDALSRESTTSTVSVSRASTTHEELCDISNDGLSALLGSLLASNSCNRDLETQAH